MIADHINELCRPSGSRTLNSDSYVQSAGQPVIQRASSSHIDLFRSTVTSADDDVADWPLGRPTALRPGRHRPSANSDRLALIDHCRPQTAGLAFHGVAGPRVIFLYRGGHYISSTTAARHFVFFLELDVKNWHPTESFDISQEPAQFAWRLEKFNGGVFVKLVLYVEHILITY